MQLLATDAGTSKGHSKHIAKLYQGGRTGSLKSGYALCMPRFKLPATKTRSTRSTLQPRQQNNVSIMITQPKKTNQTVHHVRGATILADS